MSDTPRRDAADLERELAAALERCAELEYALRKALHGLKFDEDLEKLYHELEGVLDTSKTNEHK